MKKKNRLKKTIAILLTMTVLFSVVISGCAKNEENNKTKQEQTTASEKSGGEEETTEHVKADIRVGSLKGPTSMGLVYLMNQNEEGNAGNNYTFTMETDASTLLPLMIKGELDIALIPSNVAATLYQKMNHELVVLNINTTSVLEIVSGTEDVHQIKDLKGKTLYLTGKGTTPDYVIQYLLEKNGLTTEDVTLEYKSEATEVAALLAENPDAYGLLPQPFATSACMQNPDLSTVINLGSAWEEATGGDSIVTGVTVVRKAFLDERPEAVKYFFSEQMESMSYTNGAEAARLVVKYGILGNEEVAQKAISRCGIQYISGAEMKSKLSSYLKKLYDMNPDTVGGALPKDDFYYDAE